MAIHAHINLSRFGDSHRYMESRRVSEEEKEIETPQFGELVLSPGLWEGAKNLTPLPGLNNFLETRKDGQE